MIYTNEYQTNLVTNERVSTTKRKIGRILRIYEFLFTFFEITPHFTTHNTCYVYYKNIGKHDEFSPKKISKNK